MKPLHSFLSIILVIAVLSMSSGVVYAEATVELNEETEQVIEDMRYDQLVDHVLSHQSANEESVQMNRSGLHVCPFNAQNDYTEILSPPPEL